MPNQAGQQAAEGTEKAPTDAQQLHGGEVASEKGLKQDSRQASGTLQENIEDSRKQGQEADTHGDYSEKVNSQSTDSSEKKEDGKTERKDSGKKEEKDEKQPAGGYDSTPVPKKPRGWTVRITVHRAINLPMADLNTLSSDPYVITQLYTETPNRHKEDPPLTMRTPTIRRNTDPEWDWPWTIANIPSSGFKLKLRMYDEDPSNHDDRLGNVHIKIDSVGDGFEDIKEHSYKVEKRSGSKRAYLVRAVTACFGATKHMHGELFVSIELLGRTPEDGQDGRLYTVGPCWWTKHYSPMLGRLTNTRANDDREDESGGKSKGRETQRYNFQANQIQLSGPVPKELYHRFVEFKPWVQRMFTAKGILGYLTSSALHSQHDRVYHFDRNTKWGQVAEDNRQEMTKLFLEAVHYDKGARIFTYVITLDALWRFTETGKEFGIDMLSKHSMHSDVGVYIAFSGEFFIRRLKKAKQPPPPEPIEESSQSHPPDHEDNPTHPPKDIDDGAPKDNGPQDPKFYELIIDNDSGTYRPKADLLPLLKDFLALHLPGLHILTLDCQKDAELMNKMKDQQRERKKTEGDGIVYLQGDDSSSISSSDEEDLEDLAAGMNEDGSTKHERGPVKTAARDLKLKEGSKLSKVKREYGGKERNVEHEPGPVAGETKTAEGEHAEPQASAGAAKPET